jgi:hypothetical protein
MHLLQFIFYSSNKGIASSYYIQIAQLGNERLLMLVPLFSKRGAPGEVKKRIDLSLLREMAIEICLCSRSSSSPST